MQRHRRASAITVGRLCVAQIAVPLGKLARVPHSLGLTGRRGAEVRGAVSTVAVIAWVIAMASPALAGPALLFDATDGNVLYAEDQDQPWHPASLTKIMTAYVTFVAIKEGTLTLETQIGCSRLA